MSSEDDTILGWVVADTMELAEDDKSAASASDPVPMIRNEWIGTSQFFTEDNIALQKDVSFSILFRC